MIGTDPNPSLNLNLTLVVITDAMVTAVVEIDVSEKGDKSRTFAGDGFYVQPGAHVNTRAPVALSPGDVIAHSFDLQVPALYFL